MSFSLKGTGMKSRKSRNTRSNRQIWPWNVEGSRAKTNRILPRKCTGQKKKERKKMHWSQQTHFYPLIMEMLHTMIHLFHFLHRHSTFKNNIYLKILVWVLTGYQVYNWFANFLFYNIYLHFIYLVASSLSCTMQNL